MLRILAFLEMLGGLLTARACTADWQWLERTLHGSLARTSTRPLAGTHTLITVNDCLYPEPSGAACVRRELVPLALDAYPEAYEEFKRCMLVFVFGPETLGSTVGELWAASTRAAVAAQLARTLRQAAGTAPGAGQPVVGAQRTCSRTSPAEHRAEVDLAIASHHPYGHHIAVTGPTGAVLDDGSLESCMLGQWIQQQIAMS